MVTALVETIDVEDGLRDAFRYGVISALELDVLVCRLIEGLGRRQTAARIINPLTGRPASEATIKRATKSGTHRLADWLNGTLSVAPPDEDSSPERDATPDGEIP